VLWILKQLLVRGCRKGGLAAAAPVRGSGRLVASSRAWAAMPVGAARGAWLLGAPVLRLAGFGSPVVVLSGRGRAGRGSDNGGGRVTTPRGEWKRMVGLRRLPEHGVRGPLSWSSRPQGLGGAQAQRCGEGRLGAVALPAGTGSVRGG